MRISSIRNKTDTKLFRILAPIGSFIFWMGLWLLLSFVINDSFFLPSPVEVFSELASRITQAEFWSSVAVSVIRVLAGYLAGVVIGVLIACLTAVSLVADVLFSPLMAVVRATPVVSIIILAFLLFSRTSVPSYIVILMVAPVIWANIHEGIRNTDRSLIEMTEVYRLSPIARIRRLYIPSVMPYFASAAITAFGFAWKSGVAAEIICYPDYSIGKLIYKSRTALDNTSVFALTAVVVIISILFEIALKTVIKKLSRSRLMKKRTGGEEK